MSTMLRTPGSVSTTTASGSTRHVALLVALCLALSLYGIGWGLPNGPHDWSNDSVAPLEPLAYAKRLLAGEPWSSKYPPFHFMVLGAAYAPYVAYLKVTGGLGRPSEDYPYGLADPEGSLAVFTLIARLVSVAMGVGLVLVNYHTVRRLHGPRAGLIAGLLLASSYPLIHYSRNANIDVPHLFWMSLALWSSVALVQDFQRRHYVLLGVYTAAAVATKDSIYALFVGVAPVVLAFHLGRLRELRRTTPEALGAAHRDLASGLAAFLVSLVLVFNLPFNWQGFAEHVQLHLRRSVTGSYLIEQSESVLGGELALLAGYAKFLFESSVPTVLPLALAGLATGLVRARRATWMVVLPVAAYYVFFLRLHSTYHLRYALPVFVLLTWPAARLADEWLGAARLARTVASLVLAGTIGLAVLQGLALGVLYTRDSRYAAEAWMREHIPAGATILGVKPAYSLPRFPPGRQLVLRDLWNYGGTQIADIQDLDPEYAVMGMGLQIRRENPDRFERFFVDRGYRVVAEFKSPLPLFGREIVELHSINPRIVIFKRGGARLAVAAGQPPAPAPAEGR